MTSIDRIDRLKDAPLQSPSGHLDEDTGQGGKKRKANASKRNKRRKNKGGGRNPGSFSINKYVLELCKELKEKKLFMVYNAIDILGLQAFQGLVQTVMDKQANGGQKRQSGSDGQLKTGGGVLWDLLEEENPTAYQLVVERENHLKGRCKEQVPDNQG